MKPKLFVGSSREALDIANAIHENLRHNAEVTVWNQGIFNLSESAVDSLLANLDRMDFGVFVFAPDDILRIRGKENVSVRDNVVFELGLFVGRLGRQQSFILLPSEHESFRLPSDLVGMTPGIYESDREDENPVSATAVACSSVRRRMSQLWSGAEPEAATGAPAEEEKDVTDRSLETTKGKEIAVQDSKETDVNSWWHAYFDDEDYGEAVRLLQEKVEEASEKDKPFLKLWLGRAKAKVDLDEGIQYLEALIEENREDATIYLYLSWLYEDEDLYDHSIAVLDRGLESARVKLPLSWSKAVLLDRSGFTDEAKTILSGLIDDYPKYAVSYTALADILDNEGKKDDAKEVLKLGLKVIPNDESVLSQYGSILSDLEENEAALLVYRKLHMLYPNNARYLTLLGNVYLNLNLNGLALEAYQQANEIAEGRQGWILGNIGNLYSNRGFYPQAVEFLKRALQEEPDSVYAADRLAKALKQDQEERNTASKVIREHRRAAVQREQEESSSVEPVSDESP